MLVLSWHEIDFAGVVLVGLIAGYLMALAGLWAGAVPGLVAFDIADFRTPLYGFRPAQRLAVGSALPSGEQYAARVAVGHAHCAQSPLGA